MDVFIYDLASKNATLQAVAVSAGGLLGVFLTLSLFFLYIFIAARFGKKRS
jgi:hypothetical protein